MWPVPSHSTPSLVASVNSSVLIDPSSFSKAGRKIHVGDCVLFKLPNDSLPFIGIIRRLIVGKEENLTLSVNWFYRPADVKLGKGALLEAAPNEVFYSFHKDEISAASILHPCKVAFLGKGVELPSEISSFVCRRVYDIENKCLRWLTDQNYFNSYLTQERQEELDQLLDKTRAEMHGAVQTGGRSPKPLNAPNGTTQLKPTSDSTQNKSKKRDHGVHSPDSVKRERLCKTDDADSAQLRPEQMLKTEIAKITDKGGLVDFEGVEKLIQLMQPESAEKKVDLACRVMLVDVISVTDRFDCLGRFVQLRGLLILDEWLQEVHKGKIGEGSPKGSDKSIEEFLFALLRALDRLPVNLHALQTCNVGKSVNHLRSHKNSEIQKKARSLVDTWKKRVEAEMNIIETRSGARRGGSWPNKPMMPEVSHMGTRRISGSSEVDAKISTSQPSALKAEPSKHNSGEAIAKSLESPVSTKSATLTDMPPVTIKEDKCSSSSPSANNSQSCSSDHGKTGASCREDAPSSTSGALSVNKNSSRKSSNVVHGSVIPGGQKEGVVGKFSSVNRNFASGKGSGSPSRATPERVVDVSLADNVNNPRLIVRLPNTGRSPARTASGGSLEDASTSFGKGSPLLQSEKQDHHDRRVKGKVDAPPDLRQGKEGLAGSDEAKKEIVTPCDDMGASKATGSASDVTLKPGKSYETVYSSVNALVESCAKFSEVNVSAQAGDDVGMNLLASVAAGEMSRSDVSPVGSPENKRSLPEDTCSGNDAKLRQPVEDGCQSKDNLKVTSVENLSAKGESQQQVVPPVDSEKTGECTQSSIAVITGPDVKVAVLVEDASALFSSIDATNGCKEGDEKAMENNMVQSDAATTSVKVETQINDESASSSSSEKHADEKKLMHKQSSSSNLVLLQNEPTTDSELPTTSCKAEDGEAKRAPNMDSDPSVSEHAKEATDKNDAANGDGSEEPSSKVDLSTDTAVKLDFDLNDEVFPNDDAIQGEVERPSVVHTPCPLPSTSSLVTNNRITVAAAAKGPFFPSENFLKGKSELGWKGSAATSAFRPAEPRNNPTSKQARPLFDFDLNIGVIEDASQNNVSTGGRLDLDLNACEESPDVSFTRPTITQLPPRSLLSGKFSNSEPNSSRGFDLNGPGAEETGGESMPFSRNGMQFVSSVPSVRMNNNNNMDMNFSSWFPQSNTYPMVVPGASSQRMLNPEIFRGPVLSSSPAVTFPSTTQFQFPGFPFDANFSLPSNTFSAGSTAYVGSSGAPLCFPTIPSQLVGPSGVVSTAYRPYVMSLPGGSSNVKWGSQGLDLNSGPGGADLDSGLRQLPLAGSDEQLKMFQQMAPGGSGGGLLKRKERDDGLDGDRISYKHPSWQ